MQIKNLTILPRADSLSAQLSFRCLHISMIVLAHENYSHSDEPESEDESNFQHGESIPAVSSSGDLRLRSEHPERAELEGAVEGSVLLGRNAIPHVERTR